MKSSLRLSAWIVIAFACLGANAQPAQLVSIPGNGQYCQGTTGVQFQIQNSVLGQTYQLRRQGQPGNLATVLGTGGTVAFSGNYTAGNYITNPLTNTVTITQNPLPATFVLSATNNGAYCNYPGSSGVELWIPISQSGTSYELFLGPTSQVILTGNGGYLSFGMFTTPGVYRVIATIPATSCTRTSNNITVVSNTPPTAGFNFVISNPCSATPVSFTSTSSGTGLHYSWNFDDIKSGLRNTDTTANPSHIFEAWGNGTETFTVRLLVTDSKGCTDSITHDVTVTQKPDATLLENLHLPNPNYPNTFAACDASTSNPQGVFEFVNGSTTTATNTNYYIDWGAPIIPPSNQPYNQPTFTTPLSITYNSLGFKTITYTINGANGCNNTREYDVYVGNFAGGGIGNPGNLAGVAEFCLTFPIQDNSYDNPPDTRFIFDWGDGSPVTTILRQDLPANRLISHCYTTCSVEMTGNPPKYAFKATCNTENPCGAAETSVWPIVVSCPVEGGFLLGGGGDPGGGGNLWGGNGVDTLVGCNDVTFLNTSQQGFYIIPPNYNTYTTNTVYSWNFGDPASGANNTSTLPEPTHHFTSSCQWYTVTMIAYTGLNTTFNSGYDTVVTQIFIQNPTEAAFTIDNTPACVPKLVQVTDESQIGCWGDPVYIWSVIPSTGWEFITPGHLGDSTVMEPLIRFNASGSYTLRLSLWNSCGPNVHDTTILVCEPPEVAFDETDLYFCGPGIRTITPSYDFNCDTASVTFNWTITGGAYSFTGGTSAASPFPEIHFQDYADYEVTAIINNGCGNATDIQNIHIAQSITNNVVAPITPASGQICAGQSPIVIGSSSPPTGGAGSFTYQWQQNLTCNLTDPLAWTNITVGGTLQNYTLMSPLTDTRCFRRIAFDAGECVDTSAVVQIQVFPEIINNQVFNSQQICSNTAPDLLTGTPAFGGSVIPTYQWEESLDGITFNPITGATGQDYQPGTLSQTTWFRRVALSDPCPSDYSTPVMITVCAPLSDNTISSDQTICEGTSPLQLTGPDPVGACNLVSYQWQSSTDATYPVFSDITGANASSYQPPALFVKTYFRRVASTAVSNCSDLASNEVTININPRPVPNAGIDQTISNGATANLSGTVSGGTPPYFSTIWTPTGSVQAPNNQLNAVTVNLSASTEFTLTVTDANGCSHFDRMWVMVTGSPLSVNLTTTPTNICPGGQAQLCANASGGSGTYTYSWTGPGGPLPSTQCVLVSPLVTSTYTCLVWDGFVSASSTVTVTVDPVPVITSALSLDLCSGEEMNYSPTSTVPGTTYTWTSTSAGCTGNTNSALPGVVLIDDELHNAGSDECIVTYLVTPVGPSSTFCAGTPTPVEVHVRPVPVITNNINSQTVVSGLPTSPVTFSSNVSGAGIHWRYLSTTCPGFVQYQLTQAYDPLLPSQVITLLPGAPPTCSVTYQARAYLLIAAGDTCWGTPFNYTYLINSEPVKYNMICPVPICSGQTATISLESSDIGVDYQLLRGAVPVSPVQAGTGAQLDWTGINTAGTYTIRGTNTSNGQSTLMNGLCQVTINALPQIFLLTAQNGQHCSPVTPLLSGSEANVEYRLILNGDVNNPLQIKMGTGLPGFLVFDPVTVAGTYTVFAFNTATSCTRYMQGSIQVDPEIQQFTIIPGGILCEGVNLCLEFSEPGIEYQLWLNNQPFGPVVPGDPLGGSICFGTINTAGTYRIHAENPLTTCEIFFSNEAIIHPLPTEFVMAPVTACAGAEIVLNNCQAGIEYYLYFVPAKGPATKDAVVAGPVSCTGGPLSFGNWSDVGLYRILAVDPLTNCSAWMNGSTTIYPYPEVFRMMPQGSSCPPVSIFMEDFEPGATYYLYRGVLLVATDDGTDGSVNFGTQTIPGIYTVRARFTHPGGLECWIDMDGSLEIYQEPGLFTLMPPGPLCPPASLFLNGSETGVTYTLWNDQSGIRQVITGSGGVINFLPEIQPGNYWVVASSSNLCEKDMNGIVTIHPSPQVFQVIPQGINCEPTLIGLDNAEANTTYELMYSDFTSLPVLELYTPVVNGSFFFPNLHPAGSYIIKATNGFGCDTIMNGTVIVDSSPITDAGPSADTICIGPPTIVNLNGSASHYSSILWSSPTNPSGSNFANPSSLVTTYTFTPLDIQNQGVMLKLTATGSGGCTGESFTDSIAVHILSPIVQAGPDLNSCENLAVQLNGTISGGASTGTWTSSGTGTFNDPTLLNAQYTPSLADIAAGSVTLTLTSTDASHCPDISDALTLTLIPQAAADAGPDATICETDSYSLAGSDVADATSLLWTTSGTGTFDNNAILHPVYSPSAADITAGNVTLTLTVTSASPCIPASDAMLLNFIQQATVNAGNDATICETETYTLSGSDVADATSLLWITSGTGSFDNNAILHPVYSPSAADIASGNVTLTLTVTSASPCIPASDAMLLNFIQQATVDAGPDATICETDSYSLAGSNVADATSLLWTTSGTGLFDNNAILHPVYTPSVADIAAGNVTLTLTVTSASPCIPASDAMLLNFIQQATVNAGNDATICETETYTLLTSDVADATSLLWTTSGTGTFDDNTALHPVYTPMAADIAAGNVTLTLTVTSASPCIPASDAMLLNFIQQATVDAGPDATICETDSYSLAGSDVADATSLLWTTSGTGSFDNNAILHPVYTPSVADIAAGNVTLTLAVTSASPCIPASDAMLLNFIQQATVNAGNDATICETETYTLATSDVADATSLLWTTSGTGTFDNNTILHPVYTPSAADIAAGNVTLTLTVTSASPCISASDQMLLNITRQAQVSAGPDAIICENVTYPLTGASSLNASSYLWTTNGDGSFSNNTILNPVYTPGTNDKLSGTVTLTISTSNEFPCVDVSDPMILTIHPLPVVFAGNPKTSCVSHPVSLDDATAVNITPSTLHWNIISGYGVLDDFTALNPVYTPATADGGNSVVLSLIASGTGACAGETVFSNVTLTIEPLPVADAGPDLGHCMADPFVQISNANALHYSQLNWQHTGYGSLVNPQSINPIYYPQPADAGSTVVFTLRAWGTGDCISEDSVSTMQIHFDQVPVVSAGPGGTVCESDYFELTGSAQHVSSVMWEVVTGSGTFSNPSNPVTNFFPSNVVMPVVMTLRLRGYGSGSCSAATAESLVDIQVYPSPEASAGPNDTVCGFLPYSLAQASVLNASSVTWTTSGTGQFNNAFIENPVYFPSNQDMLSGSVILTVEADNAFCSPVTDQMILYFSLEPVSYFTHTTPACSGSAIFLEDLSSAGSGFIKRWIWNYGDGSPNDTIFFPENPSRWKLFNDPGTYPVMLSVQNSLGCTDTYTLPVTLLPSPIANFHYYHPCANTEVEFTDASFPNGAGNVVSWHWDFDDPSTGVNNFSTMVNPTHIFSESNKTYNVKLIIVNYNNCSDTMVKPVFILPEPAVDFTHTTACLLDIIHFEPDTSITNIPSIGTWLWDFGDGITSNNSSTSHIYEATGTYEVILHITDTSGCTNSISHTIEIHPLPVAHFDAGTLNCSDASVHFNELSTTSVGYIVRWEWDFGDGNTQVVYHPDNPDVTHVYAYNGTYEVTLWIVSSDSCSSTESQILNIYPQPAANFDHGPSCEGIAVPFTDLTQPNGGGSVTSWSWNFNDPASGIANTSSLQNPTHSFSSTGTYHVRLIVTTSNGCADTVFRYVTVLSKPAVDFLTQNNCQNQAVQFSPNTAVMNVNSIAGWFWNFGDGTTSVLSAPTHTYPVTATYTVVLTVTDTSGCVNSISKAVVIVPEPVSNFDYSQPACRESAITFTSLATTPSGYITEWEWDFGDGNSQTVVFPGVPNVSHVYANYGTFDASLTVTTNNGCTRTMTKPVVVAPNPLANFSVTASCVTAPVQFNDLSQPGSGALSSWSWNFGDPASGTANVSSLQNPTHSYLNAASYNVRLIVTNSGGCKDTIVKQVSIQNPPTVNFSSEPGCVNDSTHFISSTFINEGALESLQWAFGDGNSSPEIDPYHIYDAPGTYTVSLSITDTSGCINSISHPVTITTPPLAFFQASTPSCAGIPVLFEDLSTAQAGQINSWYWDFGDGNDTLIQAPANPDILHSYVVPGIYTVYLKIGSSLGCEAFTSQEIQISASPIAGFVSGNSCVNEPVVFTNQSVVNGGTPLVTYAWDFGDPASGTANTSNLANPSHVYISTGSYSVVLITTNASGCSDTISHPVEVHPIPAVDFAWVNSCLGNPTQFQVNPATTNIPAVQTFDWDFGDGSPHSSLQDPEHTYQAAGNYTVVLTIADTSGCSNLVSHIVTVSSVPTALFAYPNVCLHEPIQFTDLSYTLTGEPISVWHWDFGVSGQTNDTSNLQHPQYTYQSPGIYDVTLIVTNIGGCKDTIVKSIHIYPLPVADFEFIAPACSNGTVYFEDISTGQQSVVVDWFWEFEPNHFSTERNPVYTFFALDSCYNVKLIVTDNRGCMDTITKEVCVPAALSIAISYNQSCYQDTTYFSAQVLAPEGDSLTTYSWNFGDPSTGNSNTSSAAEPQHVFSEPGTYTVVLTAKDQDDCPVTRISYVDIYPLPSPTFSSLSGSCDSTVMFTESSVGNGSPITSWFWEFGDGQSVLITQPSLADVSHKYAQPGDYTVNLTVTNARNCSSMASGNVFVSPCMQAGITPVDTLLCQNYTLLFADTSSGGIPIQTWHWDFGDGAVQEYTSFTSPVSHVYAEPGSYTVKMKITGAVGGNPVSDSTLLNVYVKPAPIAAFNYGNTCLGDSIVLKNESSGNGTILASYLWKFNDPASIPDVATSYDASHFYPVSGTYTPYLVATNTLGCRDTVFHEVVVFQPSLPRIGVSNACAGSFTQLLDESIPGSAPISSWQWSISNEEGFLFQSEFQHPVIEFENTGNYFATVMISDTNGCADSTSRIFTIEPSPEASFSFSENQDNTQGKLQFTNESSGAVQYYWNFGNGDLSTKENPVFTFEEEGEYTIQLVAANTAGCMDTTLRTYKLLFKGLYIPSAFAPGDPEGKVNIFQPAGVGLDRFKIEVFDRWGNRIWMSEEVIDGKPGPGWDGTVNDHPVELGVYIWKASAVFKDGSVWDGVNIGENEGLAKEVFGTLTVIK